MASLIAIAVQLGCGGSKASLQQGDARIQGDAPSLPRRPVDLGVSPDQRARGPRSLSSDTHLTCDDSCITRSIEYKAVSKGSRYLDAVKRFADLALEHGRDSYGPKKTPLFVDSLSVTDYKPYRWQNNLDTDQSDYPAEFISANFGMNLQLLTTLDELSKLSGDSTYAEAAELAARYGIEHLQNGHGLIFWGHHATYDALHDVVVGLKQPIPTYETKTMVPNYAYLARFDREAVIKHTAQTVNVAMLGWEKIEFTRHMSYKKEFKNAFSRAREIIPNQKVPFASKRNMLFTAYATPIIHNALTYYDMKGDPNAFRTAYYTIKRFMDARDRKTGLGSIIYAYIPDTTTENPNEYRRRYRASDQRYQWTGGWLVKKARLLPKGSQERKQLLDFMEDELVPYAEDQLDQRDLRARSYMIWIFSQAYRLTKKRLYWDYLRKAIRERDVGDIGDPAGKGFRAQKGKFDVNSYPSKGSSDIRQRHRDNNYAGFMVHALVELYRETNREELLRLAENVADQILDQLVDGGLFIRESNMRYSRLASLTPLALLDLVAAQNGRELEAHAVFPRDLYLRIRHKPRDPWNGDKAWDTEVVFCQDKQTGECR